MRWPNNAISHLSSRACRLQTEGTYRLFRELRQTPMHYVRELWYVATDRRHAKENTEARNELKERG